MSTEQTVFTESNIQNPSNMEETPMNHGVYSGRDNPSGAEAHACGNNLTGVKRESRYGPGRLTPHQRRARVYCRLAARLNAVPHSVATTILTELNKAVPLDSALSVLSCTLSIVALGMAIYDGSSSMLTGILAVSAASTVCDALSAEFSMPDMGVIAEALSGAFRGNDPQPTTPDPVAEPTEAVETLDDIIDVVERRATEPRLPENELLQDEFNAKLAEVAQSAPVGTQDLGVYSQHHMAKWCTVRCAELGVPVYHQPEKARGEVRWSNKIKQSDIDAFRTFAKLCAVEAEPHAEIDIANLATTAINLLAAITLAGLKLTGASIEDIVKIIAQKNALVGEYNNIKEVAYSLARELFGVELGPLAGFTRTVMGLVERGNKLNEIAMQDVYSGENFAKMETFLRDVESLISTARSIKDANTTPAYNLLMNNYTRVKEMSDAAKRFRLMSGHRQEPVVIHLSGPAGAGKTYFATYLREKISAELGISPAAYTCNLNADDGYWAPYCGEKWLVVDEFLAAVEDKLVKQFNGLASTGPYQMQGASLPTKDQWAQHEFIIVMSNTDRVQLPSMHQEAADAFFTRLPTVRVRFPGQNPQDPRSADGRSADCSHLRLDRVWYKRVGGAYRLARSAPLSVSEMIRLNVTYWKKNRHAFLNRGDASKSQAGAAPTAIVVAEPLEALVHSGVRKGPFTVHLNGQMGSGKSYFSDSNLHSYYSILYRLPVVRMVGELFSMQRRSHPAIYVFDDILCETNIQEYMNFWDTLSEADVVWIVSNLQVSNSSTVRWGKVGVLSYPYPARAYHVGVNVKTHQGFLRRIGIHGRIKASDCEEVELSPAEVHGCFIQFRREGLTTTHKVQTDGDMIPTTDLKDAIAVKRDAHMNVSGSFSVTYGPPVPLDHPDIVMHAATFEELDQVTSTASSLIATFAAPNSRYSASENAFDQFITRDINGFVYDQRITDGNSFDAAARHYAQILQRAGVQMTASIRAGCAAATYINGCLNISGVDNQVSVVAATPYKGFMTVLFNDGVAITASQLEWVARIAGERVEAIDYYPGSHVVAALSHLDYIASTGADPLVEAKMASISNQLDAVVKTAHMKIASDILTFARKHTFLMAVLVLATISGMALALYHMCKSGEKPSAKSHSDVHPHWSKKKTKSKIADGSIDDYDAEQITRWAMRNASTVEERRDYIYDAKAFADLGASNYNYYNDCDRNRKPLRYSEYESDWAPKPHATSLSEHGQTLPIHHASLKFNGASVVVNTEIGKFCISTFGTIVGGRDILTVAHAAPAGATRITIERDYKGTTRHYEATVTRCSPANELAMLHVSDPEWELGEELTDYLVSPTDDVLTKSVAVRPATTRRPLQLVPMDCVNIDTVFSNVNTKDIAKVDYRGHGMMSMYSSGHGPSSLTKGDCGTVLLSTEAHREKAIWGGVYTGMLGSSAFFVPVNSVIVRSLRGAQAHADVTEITLAGRPVVIDHRTAGLITKKADPLVNFADELEGIGGILGHTPTFHAHERKNEKPCRVSTGMDPTLVPSDKRPCPTKVADVKNAASMTPIPAGRKKGEMNLLYANASAQFGKKKSVGKKYYDHVLPEFLLSLPSSATTFRRKTLHEVLNGTNPSDPYYTVRGSIDVDTSPGLFYEHYYGMHDKRLFFRGEQTPNGWEVSRPLVVDTSRAPGAMLMERLKQIGDLAREGKTLACLAKTFQKRELIKNQKADDGKIRTCESMDFALNLWLAMMFADFYERRQFDREGQHMVIGADFKTEGTWMYQHLREYNPDECCAADVPQWDRNTHEHLMEYAVRAAGECAKLSPNFEGKETIDNEVQAMIWYFTRCISVLGDAVYWIVGRMPTGINMTAHINTDGHCMMLRAGAAERYERLMGHLPVMDVFSAACRVFLYGDDMIIAVKRAWYWLLGPDGIVDIYQRAGYNPTNDKKDGLPAMTPYSEASFCSRHFIEDGKITHMAIKKSTIANWLHWTSSDDPDVIASNFRVALEESIQWGKEFFTEVQHAVRTVAQPKRLPVRMYTFECGAAYLKRKVACCIPGSLESIMMADETTVDLGAQPTEDNVQNILSNSVRVHCALSSTTMSTSASVEMLLGEYLGQKPEGLLARWNSKHTNCICGGLLQGVPDILFNSIIDLEEGARFDVLTAFGKLTTHNMPPKSSFSKRPPGTRTDKLAVLEALMLWASQTYGGPTHWDEDLRPMALPGHKLGNGHYDPTWMPYQTAENMICRRALRDGRPWDGVPECGFQMVMTEGKVNIDGALNVIGEDPRFKRLVTEMKKVLEAEREQQWFDLLAKAAAEPHSASAPIEPSIATDSIPAITEGGMGEPAPNEGACIVSQFMAPTSGQPAEMMAMAGSQLTSAEVAQNVFTDISTDVRDITDQATRGTILEVFSYLDTAKWSGFMKDQAALNTLAGGCPEFQIEMHGPATNGGSLAAVWLPYTPTGTTLNVPEVAQFPRKTVPMGGNNQLTIMLEDSKLAPRVRLMDEFYDGAGGADTPSVVVYVDQPLNNGINPGNVNTIKVNYVVRARFGPYFRMGRARRAVSSRGLVGRTLRQICGTGGLRMVSGSTNNNWPIPSGVMASPETWTPPGIVIQQVGITGNSDLQVDSDYAIGHNSCALVAGGGYPNLQITHYQRVSGPTEDLLVGFGTTVGASDFFASRGKVDSNANVCTFINTDGVFVSDIVARPSSTGNDETQELRLRRVDLVNTGQTSSVILYYISERFTASLDGGLLLPTQLTRTETSAAWIQFFSSPTTYCTNFAQQYVTGYPGVKSAFFLTVANPISGSLSLPPLEDPNLQIRQVLNGQIAKFVDSSFGNSYINLLSWGGYLYVNWVGHSVTNIDIDEFVCNSVQAANTTTAVPFSTVQGVPIETTSKKARLATGVSFRNGRPRGADPIVWRRFKESKKGEHPLQAYQDLLHYLIGLGYSLEQAHVETAFALDQPCLIPYEETMDLSDFPGVRFAEAEVHGAGAAAAEAGAAAGAAAFNALNDIFVSKRGQKYWKERAEIMHAYEMEALQTRLTTQQANLLERMALENAQANAMINQKANSTYRDQSTAMSANASTQVEHRAPRTAGVQTALNPRGIPQVPNEPPPYDIDVDVQKTRTASTTTASPPPARGTWGRPPQERRASSTSNVSAASARNEDVRRGSQASTSASDGAEQLYETEEVTLPEGRSVLRTNI